MELLDQSVGWLARNIPGSTRVFHEFQLDFCCGGNQPLRQALAPWARKTSSFCQDRECMRQRVVFFQAFYNVARPHMSLRQPLPLHERTRRGAICSRWQKCTPAMAAGLTDHVWTLHELLTAKFAPLDSQRISG